MLKEFKKFALRGNMIDLAVGMIIGSAFTGIVNSLVNDMIMPVVSIFTGKVDFFKLVFCAGRQCLCDLGGGAGCRSRYV